MGNNMGGGSSKSAKVMNINGELFKMKIPSKAIDAIRDYPDHVLLDSEEFRKFKLRAKPLNPYDELKPRKIYLLVELPRFPDTNNQTPHRRVKSGVIASTTSRRDSMMKKKKIHRRSVSDNLMIDTRSSGGPLPPGYSREVGPTPATVKMRLPKAQVQRIMEENGDDNAEVAKKILRLYSEENAAVSRREKVQRTLYRHRLNVDHGISQ